MLKNPDWILTLDFFLLIFFCTFPMKGISWALSPRATREKTPFIYFFSPIYSVPSWEKGRKSRPGDLHHLLKPLAFSLLAATLLLSAYYFLISKYRVPPFLQSYLAIFPLYVLTEIVGPFVQILFLSSGYLVPPTQDHPLRSRNLSEFWGKRWNPWMQDWLRQVIYRPFQNRPRLGIFTVFLFSGIVHEAVINLPLYYETKTPLFGTMILFFMIQGVGVWIDKFYLKKMKERWRVLFLWGVLILPAPFFMNEATLRIFHLYRL